MEVLPSNEPFRFTPQQSADAGGGGVGSDDLVNQTRREIQRLVREASDLAQNSRDPDAFWPAFLDRVQRATAAVNASIWTIQSDIAVECYRVGAAYDDGFSSLATACHHRLIDEVAVRAEPVLVPPTTPNEEIAAPLNPTESLAVLVPILVDGRSEAVLQVLMPVGGGLATQRGYLRFAAQMGDLAGEFLRTETLRQVRHDEQAWASLGQRVAELHQSLTLDDTAAAIVDLAAETFDIDRVSLLQHEGSRWHVITISGVPDFDSRSPTVKALATYVSRRCSPGVGDPWQVESIDDQEDIIPVVGLLSLGPSSALLLQSTGGMVSPAQQRRWLAFVDHAAAAWKNADRFDTIPWAALQTQLFTAGGRLEGSRRSLLMGVVGMSLLALVAMLPVPMVVSVDGKLEPLDKQTVYAPRDAVVSQIAVQHGDHVQAGDLLSQLVDPELDQQIDDLLGQQSVLEQRGRELKSLMIAMAAKSSEERERIEGEFQITGQKQQGISRQLQLLEQQRERLTIRASQSGQIIGWQMQQELADRPIKRGQQLLRVVDLSGRWVVRAEVPQERLDHVLRTSNYNQSSIDVNVLFRSFPNRSVRGVLQDTGLIAINNESNNTIGMAEVFVETSALPICEPGAYATVAIPCGRKPLYYVAFQDLIRAVSEAVGVYF